MRVWQTVLAAVQVLFEQHDPLAPPQVPQARFEQVPLPTLLGQAVPLATQTPPAQHPLFEQALPAQQTWPAPPQEGGKIASVPASASALAASAFTPVPPSGTEPSDRESSAPTSPFEPAGTSAACGTSLSGSASVSMVSPDETSSSLDGGMSDDSA
jgi:hypothetical protein